MLAGPDTVTFQVAACDPRQSLIIDHTLAYAGYFGGRSRHDGGAIAMGSTGAAYVTGSAGSTRATCPITVGPDLTSNGRVYIWADAFLVKVTAGGPVLHPTITAVKSKTSEPGTAATARGTGFATVAEKNVVHFDGYDANVMKANTILLVVEIPVEIKKGVADVYIVADGLASNEIEFTVKGANARTAPKSKGMAVPSNMVPSGGIKRQGAVRLTGNLAGRAS
ncbi:MAG: IPT/TIG domain-containing protein [Acidobacteria bacterium]|nr:IPT/TIG domain-containing protein [Acidobacteriota bacterium]